MTRRLHTGTARTFMPKRNANKFKPLTDILDNLVLFTIITVKLKRVYILMGER
jgi:hypothetical protein